jgi:hypothetical protein
MIEKLQRESTLSEKGRHPQPIFFHKIICMDDILLSLHFTMSFADQARISFTTYLKHAIQV